MAEPGSPNRPRTGSQRLASQLVALAQALRTSSSLEEACTKVARAAVQFVDACDHCAVTVVAGGRPCPGGASDPIALAFDVLQQEVGEGPCLDALCSAAAVAVVDLGDEQRWSTLTGRAVVESPVRGVLAQRLRVGDRTLGSLNLYARRGHTFSSSDRVWLSLFAAHAAAALANAEEIWQLREALQSRDVISTAKGMLMAREGLGEPEAFEVLARASRRTNVKVRDLAQAIVARSPRCPLAASVPLEDRQ